MTKIRCHHRETIKNFTAKSQRTQREFFFSLEAPAETGYRQAKANKKIIALSALRGEKILLPICYRI
jgi:hypothetical protein